MVGIYTILGARVAGIAATTNTDPNARWTGFSLSHIEERVSSCESYILSKWNGVQSYPLYKFAASNSLLNSSPQW